MNIIRTMKTTKMIDKMLSSSFQYQINYFICCNIELIDDEIIIENDIFVLRFRDKTIPLFYFLDFNLQEFRA